MYTDQLLVTSKSFVRNICDPLLHDYYQEVLHSQTPGTCAWISSREEFNSWKDPTNDEFTILWIQGGIGYGKTVLAAYLVKELIEDPQLRGATAKIANFFCDSREPERRTTAWCLRAFLHQLLYKDDQLVKDYALPEYEKFGTMKTKWRVQTCRRLLGKVLPHIDVPIYFVLDGVDEYERREIEELMKFLLEAENGKNRRKLRVCIISRSNGVLSDKLHGCRLLEISRSDVLPDIKRFVWAEINHFGENRGFPEDWRHATCEKITESSEGMFLWAQMVILEFKCMQATVKNIDRTLENPPHGIFRLFNFILERLLNENDNHKADLKKLLRLTIGALRPLKPKEFEGAITLIDGDSPRNITRELKIFYGQLFQVSEKAVQLIHRSLKEFLLDCKDVDYPPELRPQPIYRLTLVDVHQALLQICMRHLLQDLDLPITLTEESSELQDPDKFIEKFPFFGYASQSWMDHWRYLHLHNHELCRNEIQELMQSPEKLERWLSIHWHVKYGKTPPRNINVLHLASYLHIPFLIDEDRSVANKTFQESCDSNGLTEIDWAHIYGENGEEEKLQRAKEQAHGDQAQPQSPNFDSDSRTDHGRIEVPQDEPQILHLETEVLPVQADLNCWEIIPSHQEPERQRHDAMELGSDDDSISDRLNSAISQPGVVEVMRNDKLISENVRLREELTQRNELIMQQDRIIKRMLHDIAMLANSMVSTT